MGTLDLRWGDGEILLPPSGPVSIRVVGVDAPAVSLGALTLWVQPWTVRVGDATKALLTFTPTADNDDVVMTVADTEPVNDALTRWVLAIDGNPVAGGTCQGNISGAESQTAVLSVSLAAARIDLSVINPLIVPAPPETGTYTLTSVDGVMAWVP